MPRPPESHAGCTKSSSKKKGALSIEQPGSSAQSGTGVFEALEDDELPAVVFIDPGQNQDEHPPHDVQLGEKFTGQVIAMRRFVRSR